MNPFATLWKIKHIFREQVPYLTPEEIIAKTGIPNELFYCGAEQLGAAVSKDETLSKAPYSPGELILLCLNHINLTQAELGKALGMSRGMMNKIIHNQRGITTANAIILEQMLHVPAHVFLRLQADYQLYQFRHSSNPPQ